MITIAADPKHLGARIGITAVLHTWGSALTHHPHVHIIVPGGGLSLDGTRWIACKPGFFLPVRVLSRLFRRLFLEGLAALQRRPAAWPSSAISRPLAEKSAFDAALAPLRRSEWVVYAKRPFAGPEAVLAYLARYTHRVAAHLASQPRSLSLPAARRSARALTSSPPKIRFDRCVNAKPAHARDRRGSSSSLAPSRLRAVGLRADACDLLAT